MADTPVIHIQANHLWALMVLAGAMCELERPDDMHIVKAAREILERDALAWLVSYEAHMDQFNAAGRNNGSGWEP